MSQLKGVVSHHEREIAKLRADRELAVAFLKAAMEPLDNPDERAAGLLALRTVAEAPRLLRAVRQAGELRRRRQATRSFPGRRGADRRKDLLRRIQRTATAKDPATHFIEICADRMSP